MATRFQVDWLTDPEFKNWIKEVPNDVHKAMCIKCHSTFSLSNMGRRAIRSHAKGAEHKRRMKAEQQPALTSFLVQNKSEDLQSTDAPVTTSAFTNNTFHESSSNISSNQSSNNSLVCTPGASGHLKAFIIKDNVIKAEILWCMQTVMTHKSMRSSSKDVTLFKSMFPDSQIAPKMQLQRTKIAYSILYGIAPYFKDALLSKLVQCKLYTIGFDESLNKISQKTQMDINVRFWDNTGSEVCTKYFTSTFLGRVTSNNIREAFKEALSNLNLHYILQISMDGPNVNHKFLRDLKAEFSGEECPEILNLGSCGLHVVHGAFKTAIKSTNWSIVEFLRALYNLFKDVPARRAMYTELSGSKLFPKKFCAIRWLENGDVAQRAIDIVSHVKLFVDTMISEKNIPPCSSFKTVQSHLEDPLLTTKLAFFISLTFEVQPFLKEYQTDTPLIPFLYTTLLSTLTSVMSRFVKADVLKAKPVSQISLNDSKNILPVSEIDLGYGTRRALRSRNKNNKVSDAAVLQLRRECMACFKAFTTKFLERSPLLFPLTKAVTCFDLAIAADENSRRIRIRNLLTILDESRWIDSVTADQAEREFQNICSQAQVTEQLKTFSRSTQRVDHYWRDIFNRYEDSKSINNILKMVMILSHGNANVERGFSVNKDCLVENMNEETLVAQRVVFDNLHTYGDDIGSFPINKSLIHSYKNARARFTEANEKRKREESTKESEEIKKRKIDLATKEMAVKIAEIKENAAKEVDALTEQMKLLKDGKMQV